MKKIKAAGLAALIVAALAVMIPSVGLSMQTAGSDSCGGAFVPTLNCLIPGVWSFSTAPTVTSGGTLVSTTATQTLTNKTLTAPVVSSVTNTGTLTLPTATGGLPVLLDCGATGTGNQTCAPVTATAATKFYIGTSTLASNAAVITFPTAFAATTSYQCIGQDITTRANPVQMLSTSGTTATITNTTGASDVINWMCGGY